MIKLISPKYLGTRTPDGVKQRVIELLYSWTRQLPQVDVMLIIITNLSTKAVRINAT